MPQTPNELRGDVDMLIAVRGILGHLPRAEAVSVVARQRGLTRSGVSGQVTRAEANPYARLKLMEYLTQHAPTINPAQAEVQAIVSAGQAEIQAHRESLAKTQRGRLAVAVFMSDIHFPAADFLALTLAYKIVEYLQPAWVSGLNDLLDFAKLSRHLDTRSLSEQAFDADVSNAIEMGAMHTRNIAQIAPYTKQPAIGSNHDSRILFRDKETGTMVVGDTLAADAMRRLSAAGLLFEAHIRHENVFRVNSGLVWLHGMSAAKPATTRATANFGYIQRELGATITDFVSGHIHKEGVTRHPNVANVRAYEAGKLCKDDMSYLRHGNDWTTGIVVSRFDPNGTYHDTTPVTFTPKRGGGYGAIVDGKTFSS